METKSLILVLHTPEHLRALIESEESYAASFGLPAAEGLRDFYASGDMSADFLKALLAATVADPWTHGFAVVHRASQSVIGLASFKGPPGVDGVVEIAYAIVSAHENEGHATEAAQALTAFAFARGQVRIVRAHTLPEANASGRVLTKSGFTRVADVVDPDDGPVWRWEKYRAAD